MISYESYKLIIDKKAQKILDNLTTTDYKKIVSKIKDLTSSKFKALNIKKLQGYKNLYRLKVDDYRVIFAIFSNQKKIAILIIGHRKEVYDLVKRLPSQIF